MTAARTAESVDWSATSASTVGAGPSVAALAELLALVAAAERVSTAMPTVMERAAAALGANGCAVWLEDEAGWHPGWTTGTAAPERSVHVLACAGGGTGEGVLVRRLLAGREAIGALVLVRDTPFTPDEQHWIDALTHGIAGTMGTASRTARLEAELERRAREAEEERRFIGAVVDALPMGLYVVDRDLRIRLWNRNRETGTQGISRQQAVGRPIFELLHRQPAEMLRREFDDAIRTGEPQTFAMESEATGALRYFRITKIPMRLDGAAVTHVITVGEDITEWRAAQERFAQGEKLAAIGQLAAGVMHEINNPLATIAVCAESLEISLGEACAAGIAVPPDTVDLLRILDSEVVRAKEIVDGLLEFSRPKPLTFEPVDVNGVVNRALFLMKHHTRFKRYRVEVELGLPPDAQASGNAEQLVRVLIALLTNAVDAMAEPDLIRVSTLPAEGDGMVAIEVVDRGEGIPRQSLPRIFEPFYTTKAPGRGTGLGLSICYGIIAEHGGRMEVESEQGEGSTFRVLLPRWTGAAWRDTAARDA